MLNGNKNINNISSVYFIGIGGIGMSALARYFYSLGKKVSGYDRTETPLTKELAAEGIAVHYTDDVHLANTHADMVVYTPAIPTDNKELEYFRNNGFELLKRSDVLKLISENAFNICIAGTHGKTTTTTMVAHILRHTGYGCNAFLGGISANYNTNFWSSENNVCVIEADEYDRSFLKLSPDVAVITAIDADHLDIYGTEENVKQAFADFAQKIKPNGLLIKKFGIGSELKAARTLNYSLQNESADVYAANITLRNGGYIFDAVLKDKIINAVRLNMGGMHNVENMMAAIAVANALDIEGDKIKNAVEAFKGVKRRFEYIVSPVAASLHTAKKELIFIDDYAHHPEELKALISGVKTLFPGKKCTLIFQPHLYTRTRDFAQQFADVLSHADSVILLPVYPARELPIAGVNSKMIFDKMGLDNKKLMSKEALLQWVQNDLVKNYNTEFGEVLVIAGAGDVDKLVAPIKEILNNAN